MGPPKGGGGKGKSTGGDGGKTRGTLGYNTDTRSRGGGGARPQDVCQLLLGSGSLAAHNADKFSQQLQGLRLSQMPSTSGRDSAGWEKVHEAWQLVDGVLSGNEV
jgi:hypothetical protein